MRILIIGNGHGFEAAVAGLTNLDFDLIPKDLDSQASLDFIDKWIKNSNDLVISSSFRHKIPISILSKCNFMNIHYALFPKYRGLHSIVWAMLNNEKKIGITFHIMDDNFDSGPILKQFSIKIGKKTSWELMTFCDELVRKKITRIVRDFQNNKLHPHTQNHKKATYVGKRNLNDCRVDWDKWDYKFFSRALKALVEPYPLPFFYFKNEKIEIFEATVKKVNYEEINGHLVNVFENQVWIKIPSGILYLNKIKINNTIYIASEYFNKLGIRFN